MYVKNGTKKRNAQNSGDPVPVFTIRLLFTLVSKQYITLKV